MKIFLSILFTFACYAVLSQAPAGYYSDAENKSGITLQAELHNLIDNHTVISYSELWSAFSSTDSKSNGKVWDIYSDRPGGTPDYEFSFGSNQCGNYGGEGDCYNREHSFPQSWFNEQSPMVSDLFQIYPTDGFVNGRRGNYPYGETNAPTWVSSNGCELGTNSTEGYSGIVFEPIDAYKGDLARTYFYMATRYYSEDSNWPGSPMVNGAQPAEWAKNLLISWHRNDPVSAKEIARNNAVYQLQGNRNPFIDHPEYAGYIWGGEVPDEEDPGTENPVELISHANDFSASFINLNWTDASGGNNPDGYLIVYNATGFIHLPVPTDGTSPGNYTMAKVVQNGAGKCTIGNLEKETRYYFKIYSFSGSGSATDYKTDGAVPQIEKSTQ